MTSTAPQRAAPHAQLIYQVVTDRFFPAGGWPTALTWKEADLECRKYIGGDWNGLIERLDYVSGMFVSDLWISPPFENVACDIRYGEHVYQSYHGYWPRDWFAPNQNFGSLEVFRSLVAAARDRGIGIILDFVTGHTSPASTESSNFAEDGVVLRSGQHIAAYSQDPKGMFLHNGGANSNSPESLIYQNLYDLASFDLASPQAQAYLKAAIKHWLDMGIAGVRWDAVKNVPPAWMHAAIVWSKKQSPGFHFGEWFLGAEESAADCAHSAKNNNIGMLNYPLAHALREVFRDKVAGISRVCEVLEAVEKEFNNFHDLVSFLDNHDMDRFCVEGGNPSDLTMALAVQFLAPGIPCVYYGTEQHALGIGDPANRGAMLEFDITCPTYLLIATLAKLRREFSVLRYGSSHTRFVEGELAVIERKLYGQRAIIAINCGADIKMFRLAIEWPDGVHTSKFSSVGGSLVLTAAHGVVSFVIPKNSVVAWHENTDGASLWPTLFAVESGIYTPHGRCRLQGENLRTTNDLALSVGGALVTADDVIRWDDFEIDFMLSAIPPGSHPLHLVNETGQICSRGCVVVRVISAEQVVVRLVVQDVYTHFGENIYVYGDVVELGGGDPDQAQGPFFNQILHSYPNWYLDVSLPLETEVELTLIKRWSEDRSTITLGKYSLTAHSGLKEFLIHPALQRISKTL